MGAAMIGTMYFLRVNCAQHGGKASGGGLISASLLSYRALSGIKLGDRFRNAEIAAVRLATFAERKK